MTLPGDVQCTVYSVCRGKLGLQEKLVFAIPPERSVWSQEDCVCELYIGFGLMVEQIKTTKVWASLVAQW